MASSVQNKILTKLLSAESLRYAELRPNGVPNDLFNYHLQFLVKKGLVRKADDGYALSEEGVRHVAEAYPLNPKGELANLFKVNVITIATRKGEKGIEVLVQVRKRHPSYGKKGVMGGSVRKGEKIEAAAVRKLEEETGLVADSFRMIGSQRRVMYAGDDLFSDIFYYFAHTESFRGEPKNTEFGDNMWLSIDDAVPLETGYDSIPGIRKALEMIRSGAVDGAPFFFDEVIKTEPGE